MMDEKQTPLQIEGVTESIYGDFWLRLAALLLDVVIAGPFFFLILFINGFEKNIYFYTLLPLIIFQLWFSIYLPKKYGGTPGKLIVGIKIIRLNGEPIDWKEAILRYSPFLVLTIVSTISMTASVLNADELTFVSLSWLKRSRYMTSLSPVLHKIYLFSSNIWMFSELIVLLCNKRKRATHDFIAGTVVVKTKYVDKIKESMTPQ